MVLLVVSGVVGAGVGYGVAVGRNREVALPNVGGTVWAEIYDFLAHDLYLERFYRVTIVTWITMGARLTAWMDRYLVDSIVNLVGLTSLFSGQLLRYTNSGQSQNYMLTILIGILLVMGVETMVFWR